MWARFVNAALGVWLIVAPAVLGYGAPASINDRIVGPVAVACALIAIWEVTRPVRWVNLGLALWLLVAPWLLGYWDWQAAIINSLVVGAVMALMSAVRGPIAQQFGGGWTALWRGDDA